MAVLREQFPIFEQQHYINSCSYGALALNVKAAMSQYLDDRINYGERWPHWVGMLEQLRSNTATLFNANASEIALTASLSNALNALVSAELIKPGKNKVVCTSFDFPTTAQIWHAQTRKGAVIDCVDLDHEDQPDLAVCAHIDDQTAVVSIPLVCFRNGIKTSVERIVSKARQHDALVILDGYQGAGTMRLDVNELGVDVLLGGYLKYLLGTSGMAYMYVNERRLAELQPSATGWFAQEDVHAMSIAGNDPALSARRFENGTPNIPAVYACLAGLALVQDVGIPAIEQQINHLGDYLRQAVEKQGWQLASGTRDVGPMLAIKTNAMDELVEKLRQEGVIVSCRDNNIRVSPHFYNNEEDIDRLVEAMSRYPQLLQGL